MSSGISLNSFITELINLTGKPASVNFCLMRWISSSKLLLISRALYSSVRMAFFLYLDGILDVHNIGNLWGFVYSDVVMYGVLLSVYCGVQKMFRVFFNCKFHVGVVLV